MTYLDSLVESMEIGSEYISYLYRNVPAGMMLLTHEADEVSGLMMYLEERIADEQALNSVH